MRQPYSSSAVVVGLLLVLGAGCAAPQSESVAPASEPTAEVSSEVGDERISLERDGLTLTAMPDSPKFPDATLSLEDLGASLEAGPSAFHFGVEGYELGVQTADAIENGLANSAKGQHIHLILDNGPYSAHYEPDVESELSDGRHVMLAFLSRSYHESVKEPSAYVIRQFTVGGDEAEEIDLAAPHLFYSRPKGIYKGADTAFLMLDFYLVNTTISPHGNRVRATINGTEFELTEWVPYVIEGLPLGDVEIALELVDADGNPVPGPFNQVTRTVTLEAGD